jgi:hypothetical protein
MMDLLLKRYLYGPECTLGELSIDGAHFCWTLEPPRDVSHPYIPEGRYEISITFSNRFKKPLPLLHAVPGRDSIRIHNGNWAKDTEGCILVGAGRAENAVTESRWQLGELMAVLQPALLKEKVYIIVTFGAEAA